MSPHLVLVNQSPEKVSLLEVRHTVDLCDRRRPFGSPEPQSAMRSLLVVVLDVDAQNPIAVPRAEDQHPVQAIYA